MVNSRLLAHALPLSGGTLRRTTGLGRTLLCSLGCRKLHDDLTRHGVGDAEPTTELLTTWPVVQAPRFPNSRYTWDRSAVGTWPRGLLNQFGDVNLGACGFALETQGRGRLPATALH
jgi:hypothetical protein